MHMLLRHLIAVPSLSNSLLPKGLESQIHLVKLTYFDILASFNIDILGSRPP